MTPEEIAAAVDVENVRALLVARQSDILDSRPAVFEGFIRLASTDLLHLVGAKTVSDALRALIVTAVEYRIASEIEYAEYPEQQAPGEPGRGYFLRQRYDAIRTQIEMALRGAFSVRIGNPSRQGNHLPWCNLAFGASWCSCGADIAGEPIFELGGTGLLD